MENPFLRGLTYHAFFTAVFTLMSYAMEANGAAHPRNPAWHLISGIRNLFFYSWVLLLLGGVLLLIIALFGKLNQEAKRKDEEKAAEEHDRLSRIKNEQRRIEEKRKADERKEREKAEREREKEEREAAWRREAERKKKRSADDAVESALDEFG